MADAKLIVGRILGRRVNKIKIREAMGRRVKTKSKKMVMY
jgi:hypothetical protein